MYFIILKQSGSEQRNEEENLQWMQCLAEWTRKNNRPDDLTDNQLKMTVEWVQ